MRYKSKQQAESERKLHEARMISFYDKMFRDAGQIGFGFMIMKHSKKYGTQVYHASWMEVEAALKKIGAWGPSLK